MVQSVHYHLAFFLGGGEGLETIPLKPNEYVYIFLLFICLFFSWFECFYSYFIKIVIHVIIKYLNYLRITKLLEFAGFTGTKVKFSYVLFLKRISSINLFVLHSKIERKKCTNLNTCAHKRGHSSKFRLEITTDPYYGLKVNI